VHIGDDVRRRGGLLAIEGRGLGVRIAEPGTPTRGRGASRRGLTSALLPPLVDGIERRERVMSDGRRLVIVSNRVPRIESSAGAGEARAPRGRARDRAPRRPVALPREPWFGWSGRIADPFPPASITRQLLDGVELIGSPLSRQEFDRSYLGYCNETLWPLLHCFQGRVRIDLEQEKSYREVQAGSPPS